MSGASPSTIAQALADPVRFRIVERLTDGPAGVYEVADPSVGQLVESLGMIAGRGSERLKLSPALARARTCYDHLAGRLGVAIFDTLVARRVILHPAARYRGPVVLGPAGERVFGSLGVELDEVHRERRHFATACGDWSERRAHLGGALGAALWVQTLEHGWVVRKPGTRVIVVTPRGRRAFERDLGVPREALTT